MVFNFLFFTVKIERNDSSAEACIAALERERILQQIEETRHFAAAHYPNFVSRI
ncbi:YrzI family small protein [Brevibacillus sp. SYP-B805]|uniref:YrzI family small protein n=1 Tax=Brevibacillus sp. SYP-B805 TaxID=1578199 RepID=UPI0013ED07D8|nr:YrzI family small protein [Brevibacillus sp. SYP-B805]NGQ97389.1 YrzI family small protein [Brevibacillus sp. SYP-B805]